jgi:hypothetical protein
MAWPVRSAGVLEHGMLTGTPPGTWEARRLHDETPERGEAGTQYSRPEELWPGSSEGVATANTQNEPDLDGTVGRGNTARRDGRQGVGAFHSTDETGEVAPGDPVEGRECRVIETLE